MAYATHFAAADAVVAHLQTFVPTLNLALQAQYAGFAAVSSVTVYELAIKEILFEFASKKNPVFGRFVDKHFERINGRVGLKSLRNEHIPLFGDKYSLRFDRLLNAEEDSVLRTQGASVKASYGNIVTWRNSFAHEGQLPVNATFNEVIRSYEIGKLVIHNLAKTMVR